MLSTTGVLVCSTLQVVDPYSVIFSVSASMTPFLAGCLLGMASSAMSFRELELMHMRARHPEFGIRGKSTGYGTWS